MFAVAWHKYNQSMFPIFATIGPIVPKKFCDKQTMAGRQTDKLNFSDPYTIYVCSTFVLPLVSIPNLTSMKIVRETS